MTTRELIATIRAHADGNEEFNTVILKAAQDIEDFMGGPEEIAEKLLDLMPEEREFLDKGLMVLFIRAYTNRKGCYLREAKALWDVLAR